jgi:cytidine deaminase
MDSTLSRSEKEEICKLARSVADVAYAPYSKFRVGAVVLGKRGVHVAANVENASYGLSLCAERAALAKAVSEGEEVGDLRALAVACVDASSSRGLHELLPCGACRQWMDELRVDGPILICRPDGQVQEFYLSELLPKPFRLGNAR